MKSQLFYAGLLAFFVFLSSCAIEKRHYTGGYHVESFWNGKVEGSVFERRASERRKNISIIDSDTTKITESWIDSDTVQSLGILVSEEPQQVVKETAYESASWEVQPTGKMVLNVEQDGERVSLAPDPEKKYLESLGFLSLLIAIIGFFVPIGAIFFFIAAIIAGRSSQKKFRKNPGKYMGAGFGILGVILGVVGIIGILWILFAMGLFAT